MIRTSNVLGCPGTPTGFLLRISNKTGVLLSNTLSKQGSGCETRT